MDLSKFRKDISKSIPGLSIGFRDPKVWISTGNYALNYCISGMFKDGGIPLGKVTMLAGQSGCLPGTAVVKVRYNTEEKIITVDELRHLWFSEEYDIEIDTPDGYQPIVNWWDKGPLPMVNIKTDSGSTICADNHLLQVIVDKELIWKMAAEIDLGDVLLSNTSPATVLYIEEQDEQECYDFEVGHENHRYWGDGFSSHNSGKSFISSGNIIKNAQKKGVFCILIDSENALDEKWLHALGVKTDDDSLLKINMAMIDDVAKLISDFMKEYKAKYGSLPEDDRPKVLFVIDSLGMLMTPTDVNQFESGDLKGDMGRKPKALTALVRNCVNMFGEYDAGLVCTNHSYASQDMFNPDDVISGGNGMVYASSIVVAMRKLKLKEDDDGNKTTTVQGIRAQCKVMKTRYNKPFEDVTIKIPYETGMDPYSGLVDLFEGKGLLTKEGNRLSYTKLDGSQIKLFRKAWEHNENSCLDTVINEFEKKSVNKKSNIEENESTEPTTE
jgi:RecA/RadA recombinase